MVPGCLFGSSLFKIELTRSNSLLISSGLEEESDIPFLSLSLSPFSLALLSLIPPLCLTLFAWISLFLRPGSHFEPLLPFHPFSTCPAVHYSFIPHPRLLSHPNSRLQILILLVSCLSCRLLSLYLSLSLSLSCLLFSWQEILKEKKQSQKPRRRL
ncbi:hypothetical protein F5H01DRAFT_336067 [Linnemannia elongata]|nr:hypothetical protein F5H01DRAFT_336067 [Linnemannia elongata]